MTDLPETLRTGEIAVLLAMKPANVYKWMRVRGIKPVGRDPQRGWSLYDRETILAARAEWLKNGSTAPGGQVAHNGRKATARARAAGRG